MQPPIKATAILSDKVEHNEKFTQYTFELTEPHSWSFQAGQYISLKVSDRGDRRSYSIVSSPTNTHGFELLIENIENGVGSGYLKQMPFGEQVEFMGPMGVFTVVENIGEEALVFIATGSGVAPFRSMILDQLQNKHDTREITLYWGMRFVDKLFWMEELQQLAEAFPNFHFHPVISRAVPEWPLCAGRVTDCLSVHQLPAQAGYYVCGSSGMISDVVTLLGKKEVAPEYIHHEKFH